MRQAVDAVGFYYGFSGEACESLVSLNDVGLPFKKVAAVIRKHPYLVFKNFEHPSKLNIESEEQKGNE